MAEALPRAADAARRDPQVNNRKLAEGFFRGVGASDPAAVLRAVDKLDKVGPAAVARAAARRRRADRRQRPSSAWRWPQIRTADTSFVDAGPGAGRRATRCWTRDSTSSPPVVEAALRARRPGRSSPTCRSPAGSTTTPAPSTRPSSSGTRTSARSAPAAGTTPWPPTGARRYPGVGISLGRDPAGVGCCSAAAWCGQPVGADLRAGRRRPTRPAGPTSRRGSRHALRARGIAAEVAPEADKFGKQIRHADRRGHPVRLVPRHRRASVKDIRCGEQVAADPASWTPPAADLHPQVARTDPTTPRSNSSDPHPRRRHPARRARRPDRHPGRLGGPPPRPRRRGLPRPARRLAAWSRWSCVTPEVAHPLRDEYCLRVVGEVSPGRRATRTRTCPPARSRSSRRRSTCSASPRRCRSRSTSTSRSARRRGCATATWTCAGPGPARAIRLRSEVNRVARERAARAGVRRDRDPDADPVDARGRPRLPGAGPAAARAAGTRCRRARSCSSSC